MKPHVHRIRFIGGPSDGGVVVATSFPFGDKLWMPASPVAIEPGTNCCYMPTARCLLVMTGGLLSMTKRSTAPNGAAGVVSVRR